MRPGTIGAIMTVTGMPAAVNFSIVSTRFDGVAARGSIFRAIIRSSVVTEIATLTRSTLSHAPENIGIANDERRLRDDTDGVIASLEHFEYLPA